jgi:hypothetical protein
LVAEVKTIQFALSLFGAGCLFLHCTTPQQPTAQQAAAEAAYGAALVLCVEQANTLAESKACRAEVNRKWGIVETRSAR